MPFWYRDYDDLNTPAYGWKGYFTDYTFESDGTVTTNQIQWTDEMMNDFQQSGGKRYNIGDNETLIGLTNYFIPKIEKITLYEYLHDTNAPWRPLYVPENTETMGYTDWAGRPMGFLLNKQNLDPADQEVIKQSLDFTPQQARQLLENILGYEIVITNLSEQVEKPPQTTIVTNQPPETPTPLPSVAEPESLEEIHGLTKRNWLSVLMIAGGSALVVMVLLYAFWPRKR
ncbi:hypothetical protein QPK87_13280 [Kamptonema cortianum]|nr:hypothetical protein [Kamptonema cortianum]